VKPIIEAEAGHFLAELEDLSGRPALVDAEAITDVEALLIPPQRLRTLLIAETELGDKA
jgi:thioredoxin reductase (NADPH)